MVYPSTTKTSTSKIDLQSLIDCKRLLSALPLLMYRQCEALQIKTLLRSDVHCATVLENKRFRSIISLNLLDCLLSEQFVSFTKVWYSALQQE